MSPFHRVGCSAGLGAWSQVLMKRSGKEPASSASVKKTGVKGGSVRSQEKREVYGDTGSMWDPWLGSEGFVCFREWVGA